MTRLNTKYFGTHVQTARQHRQLDVVAVDTAAAVDPDVQHQIENGENIELNEDWLRGYDSAFGWPHGYAAAVAEMGQYRLNPVNDEALRGRERDADASQMVMRDAPEQVWKTFAGLYDHNKSTTPHIGFDARTGEPVVMEGPTLTNIDLRGLGAMMLSRHGNTTVDVNLLDHTSQQNIELGYNHQNYRGAAQNGFEAYATGVTMRYNDVTNIGVDPLVGLRFFDSAKSLAASLLDVRPDTPTTVMRAALTFFAAATYDDQPLTTLIQLKRAQTPDALSAAGAERVKGFQALWDEKFRSLDMGWDAAQPDPAAVELLAGIVASRDAMVDVAMVIRAPDTHAVEFRGPEDLLMLGQTRASVLFYDSDVAPELPIALHHYAPGSGLIFYRTTVDRTRLGAQRPLMYGADLIYPVFTVGVNTDADDHTIVEKFAPYALSTLTNYYRGQAIYCTGAGAQRIWIPQH